MALDNLDHAGLFIERSGIDRAGNATPRDRRGET
jgi:hypothetical protein